ncbi:site-specific DNA-methyltransferase [Halomonas sp. 7T]|uniref:site-specific DNA-methyltransferase n=1 Tax=Halomonas sp. 7T TaxID=2893469 RepID=UPI0021D88D6E|nr:site-specific DNA-methyltransferase [Halomonas sp. 7T]UXZ55633.1 site-specific DNA-methyltransferase [Halomonas sp. 7T]
MDKLKMHSPNLTEGNIAKLAELFPSCVTEARDEHGKVKQAIDFDQLRQELSDHIVEGPQERYHLNWPGKRDALLAANAPIAKTLRPCREESVDFDSTKNLFIEGDNLEALKLLQESYLGKIKVIYIDPPYNTGKDFIYKDRFSDTFEDYMTKSNQRGDYGEGLVSSSEAQGKKHSNWLSMIYPRLKLARNLLRDNGVVFISIDDNEIANLERMCSEIFGEDNLLGRIIWKNATDNNPSNIAVEHEYILACCKNRQYLNPVWKSAVTDIKEVIVSKGKELNDIYKDEGALREAYKEWFKKHKSQLWPLDGYKYIDQGGVYAGIRGVHNPGKEGYRYDVLHPKTGEACVEPLMGYRFPKETMNRLLEEDRIIFGDDHNKLIELKAYAHDYKEKLSSVIELDGRSGAYDVRELFPEYKTLFENPKPVKLLQRLLSLTMEEDGDVFLDFFAGSSSSAHALMDLNKKDSKNRPFIMVQLPEPCAPSSEAYKKGLLSIDMISKERIRRVGKKLADNVRRNVNFEDYGFRVLKLDVSCFSDVYYNPGVFSQDILNQAIDNIRQDRNPEDLLFQVLLDWGVDLSLPIAQRNIAGKTVYFVDGSDKHMALAACFDLDIDEAFVKQLAEYEPLRAVFRDAGFANDSVKINVEQIFAQKSPTSEVKVI